MHELKTIKAVSSKPAALAAELERFDNVLTAPSYIDASSPPGQDESASLQFLHGSTTHIGHTCRCFQKLRSTARWGSTESILGSGSLFLAKHRANCPLKMSERGIHSSLRYALPRWLLNLTVEAQFKMTLGAGGFSLPSSLVFKYTVSDQSPMIRLLSTFKYESAQERIQNPILPRVRNLFLEGKASPSDVDASGNNYLNVRDNQSQSSKNQLQI